MVFSSLLFVFQFLPVALILYYISPKKLKNLTLFVVSIIFYSWGEVRYFPVMLATILVNYLAALAIEKFDENQKRHKLFLVLALTISFGFLLFFKYLGFFVGEFCALFGIAVDSGSWALNLTLPLGISFYTFQTLSYTIDVYRRKVPADHNFINVGAFVTLFPQLIAGPIVRYTDIRDELLDRALSPDMLKNGMEDFVLGLARKVLIANSVGALWTEVSENIGFASASTGLSWLALLAFTLQIYFDFSGYSQMAIGLGKMLGFNFPQNFNVPYTSRSVTEFWRRWHMTLGSWFREYVYFPLGGSRRGYWRTILNLLIVWALTGFWHGASWNFILWGLYFFVLLFIEKSGFLGFLNKHKVLSHVYALFAVIFGWALFSVTDLAALGVFLNRLFVPTIISGSAPVGMRYYLGNYAVVMIIGTFASSQTAANLYQKIRKVGWLRDVIILALFLLCAAYLVDASFNPFLYFRF